MIDRVDPFGWRIALLCAILWGIAVSLADMLIQPIGDLDPSALLDFLCGRLWQWIPTGLVWVLGSKLIARGRFALVRAILLLPFAIATNLGAMLASPTDSIIGDAMQNQMGRQPLLDLATFLLWTNIFYGGLYVLGYLSTRRANRFRRRLAELRLAQSEADALIREARVNAYRGQLQPAMLLAALTTLRRRYSEDRVAGDRLFELLVTFLRAAMPSVRSGFSTLSAELETVRSYAELRGALGIDGPTWTLSFPDDVRGLPFPSLILLPALDELSASLPIDAQLRLSVADIPQGAILRIEANQAAALSDQLDRRLRGGLALTFGSAATTTPDPVLPIEIRLRAQALDQSSDAYPHPTGAEDEAIVQDNRHDTSATTRNG